VPDAPGVRCGPDAVQNASFGGKVNVRVISGRRAMVTAVRASGRSSKVAAAQSRLPRAVRQTRDEARIVLRHPGDDPAGRLAALSLKPLSCGALASGSEPRAGSSIILAVTK
jgi:hypothetical protein